MENGDESICNSNEGRICLSFGAEEIFWSGHM
jgi:hypothetical protein